MSNISRDSLEIIDKLKYLSECIDRKCEALASRYNEITLDQLLNLCGRIRKNCESFEEVLFHEKMNCSESLDINSELVITLNLLDILGEENCKKLKHDQVNKFKTDLKVFTKNYLMQTKDPVFFDLCRLFLWDSTNGLEDSTRNQEILSNSSDQPKQTNTDHNPQHYSGSSNEVSINGGISSINLENERLPSADRLAETDMSKTDEEAAGPSKQANSQLDIQPSLGPSNEVSRHEDVSIEILQKEPISSADGPAEIDLSKADTEAAGPSNQANIPQNPQHSSSNSIEVSAKDEISSTSNHEHRPEEIAEAKESENVAECIEDSATTEIDLGATDIEDRLVAEQNSTENIESLISDVESSSADQPNLDDPPKTTLEDHSYFKNVSVDSANLVHETGKCAETLEPVIKHIDNEGIIIPLVDQGIEGNSKKGGITSYANTPEFIEKSMDETDIVNSSKEEQDLEEPHDKLVPGTLGPPMLVVDEKLRNDDESLLGSVEQSPAVITDHSVEIHSSESVEEKLEVSLKHQNSKKESSPVSVNSSLSTIDSVEKTQSQESLSELQCSAVSDVGSSTNISEYAKDEEEKNKAEVEPCGKSTTVETASKNSEDFANETIKDNSSVQNVSDENSSGQQLFLTNLGLSKASNYEKVRCIRDELMEIFAEVNCQEDRNGVMRQVGSDLDMSSESSEDEDKYCESKVASALKELEEESLSDDEMMSGSELDLSCLDDSLLYEYSDSEKNDKDDIQEEAKKTIDNFIPRKCSVILERSDLVMMKLQNTQELLTSRATTDDETDPSVARECSAEKECPEISKGKKSADEDAEIDRLCQLSTLDRKRRLYEKKSKRKMKRKRRVSLSGTETSDLSGYSSVSDNEIRNDKEENANEEDDDTPLDPNTLLAEIVCHTIHDSDSDSSAVWSNEEDGQRCKRKKIDVDLDPKNEEDIQIKKEKESSWKDDPLLRGNLNITSERERKGGDLSKKRRRSSDIDCNKIKTKNTKTSMRRYLYPDDSDSLSDSADDFEDDFRVTKIKKDDDSDIEIVNTTSTGVINVDSEEETEDKKSSRKNIKSVLSTKSLTESTQRAAEEEDARIRKLDEQKQMRSSQQSKHSEDELVLDVSSDGSKIIIDHNLSKKLFPHQVEGVKFMWESCYLSVDNLKTFQGTGCILAHNMGLGKTLQVVTLVHTLFNHPVTNTKHVLVVCPLSTVSGWRKEFVNALKIVKESKDIKISYIESRNDRRTKCSTISRWRKSGGVLIIGYDAFSRLTRDDDALNEEVRQALVDPGPDLVVCDEGHILKNGQSMRTKALMKMRTKRRIALTGTPLQNNLKEYYFMVQFVKPNLLGNNREFNRQFVNPIMNGQYEDSQDYDITLMKKRTHVLHRLLKNTVQRFESTELKKYLQNMQDYAIFIQLHPLQEKLYRNYLDIVRGKLREKNIKSFFVDYQILKYICSHPQLLHTMETQNTQRNMNTIKETEVISQEPEVNEVEGVPQDWWKSHCSEEVKTNLEFGTKLQVMMAIIEEAEKINEKVLIFTSSLVELSSVEFFLKLKGTPKCSSWRSKRDYFRMDGTVPPAIRTNMCDMFNDENNKTLRVFLMSHKVGGLGLNLTAANRVILLGANFNPSLDSQSIYRAYRFGQTKIVYIYRLLSMGTMEEKIYHRCVTKLAIASRVVDKHQIRRHYKNLDLEDLYNVEIDLSLQKPTPAKPDDDLLSTILLKFECVHKFHHHQKLLENRPDEDLNEEDQTKAWEEFKEMIEREKNGPPNSVAPKIPDLVQTQWNQLHRNPNQTVPSVPQWKVSFTDTLRKLVTSMPEKTSSTVQIIDGAIRQAGSSTNTPNTPNNTLGIPSRSNSENRGGINPCIEDLRRQVNSKAATYAKSSTIDDAISQARSSTIPPNNPNNTLGIPSRINAENRGGVNPRTISGVTSQSKNSTVNRTVGVGKISDEGRRALLNAAAQILHVSNSSREKYKSSKPKSSSIGPNPLVLAKLKHRKENLSANSSKTPWRVSSSDDFQNPSYSNVGRKTKSKASDVPTPTDDDVIVIDISDDRPATVEEQLEELRQRNMTITTKKVLQKGNDNPPVIDIT